MGHGDSASSQPSTELRQLVEMLARALVDDPNSVTVREIVGTSVHVYELSVAKSDVGKIVGKSGRNITALRTIITAVGAKLNCRAMLELIEPE